MPSVRKSIPPPQKINQLLSAFVFPIRQHVFLLRLYFPSYLVMTGPILFSKNSKSIVHVPQTITILIPILITAITQLNPKIL